MALEYSVVVPKTTATMVAPEGVGVGVEDGRRSGSKGA